MFTGTSMIYHRDNTVNLKLVAESASRLSASMPLTAGRGLWKLTLAGLFNARPLLGSEFHAVAALLLERLHSLCVVNSTTLSAYHAWSNFFFIFVLRLLGI